MDRDIIPGGGGDEVLTPLTDARPQGVVVVNKPYDELEAALRDASRGELAVADDVVHPLLEDPKAPTPIKARALHVQGLIVSFRSKPIEALQVFEHAVREAQAAGDLWCVARCLCGVGTTQLYAGNSKPARSCFSGALEMAVEAKDKSTRAAAVLGLGWVSLVDNVYDQAKAMLVEASVVAQESGDKLAEADALIFLAEIARVQREGEAARQRLSSARKLAEETGSLFHRARVTSTLARLAQHEGKLDDAARLFQEAIEMTRPIGLWFMLTRGLLGKSRAMTEMGDTDAGEQLIYDALDVAIPVDDTDAIAMAFLALGRLASTRGAQEDAGAFYRRALECRRTRGDMLGMAESLEALAGHLGRSRASTAARLLGAASGLRDSVTERPPTERCPCCQQDRANVAELLDSDQFNKALRDGASLSPDEIFEYALRGRGPKRPATSGWSSLSTTEIKVAELVEQGLTNPEIGERLFMGRRTASSHLSSIYRKLSIHSRQQLRDVVRHHRVD